MMFESRSIRTGSGLRLLSLLFACAAVIGAIVFTASQTGAEDAKKTTAATETGATVKVDDVLEHPENYVGKIITVSGEVDEVNGAQAFTLESGLFGLGKGLLVLSKHGAPGKDLKAGLFVNDDKVTVTGVVRKLVIAEVEKEIGWDLATEWETKFKEKPVIIAENVTKLTM